VGKLRALGNAIVPQVAAEVIGAYMEYDVEQLIAWLDCILEGK
jgi:hypothetical protein